MYIRTYTQVHNQDCSVVIYAHIYVNTRVHSTLSDIEIDKAAEIEGGKKET